ncbi:hypothetical protein FNV43_RR05762 [Rhamnella rubrinervis]|uniref:Cytochrome b561 and DOMON domain-containing protein n=1 Tax=Rhamnella rubrinervis TaxID=2594499 RepID=A0A8K0MRF1_9ROSA|nr:hypothetical protein FNV43_RR05762 [Rhamnella rubrinervis]
MLSFILLFVSCASCMALPHPLPCMDHKFPDGKSFVTSKDLTLLNSFLHWNYYPSSCTVDIAFRQIGESNRNPRWVAWAINPTSTGMVGSQALVAFQKSDGTLSTYSSPITSYDTSMQKGNFSFPMYDISALSDGKIESSKGENTKKKATIKNVHGFLNAISWGILMPTVAMLARHVKVFKGADPAWFYLHVTCQCVAYWSCWIARMAADSSL